MAQHNSQPVAEDTGGDPDLAALEALADEIQAECAEAAPDDDGSPGRLPAGTAPSLGPWVHDCWEQAIDMNSKQPYWFNRATGVSQWHPPPSWRPSQLPQPSAIAAPGRQSSPGQQTAADPATGVQEQQPKKPGYYYRDAFGRLQGPFTLELLRGWRGMLAMNLPILHIPLTGTHNSSDGSSDKQSGSSNSSIQQCSLVPGGQQQESSESASGPQVELAVLLGDAELLEQWRLHNPDTAAWPGSAPPATVYEAERQRGSAHSLAEAVLFGLPAHDEAVAVARLAAASGKSIQEVVEWSHTQNVDYTITAHRVAAKGRIQAPTQELLYAEAASWADPRELEQQLARAAERRKRALTAEELRAVKERKRVTKEKKQRAWLLT